MAKPTAQPYFAFPTRLAVWTLGLAGGTGRSATAGLLAAALTERFDPQTPTGPVVLLDGAAAASSPWPRWLQAPLDASRDRAAAGHPVGNVLNRVDVGAWPVRSLEPGLELRVATDVGGQLAPGELPAALRDVAAGVLPAVLSAARAYVIDGPSGQLDGLWWAAHRDPAVAHEQLLHQLLGPGRPPGDLVVVVLHVRADAAGLTSALDTVTCLARLGIQCDRMVVCGAVPAGGMSRAAKVRAELLRGHVGDVVLLPHFTDVAKAGAPAYTDPGLRNRASGLIDAVLHVAAAADAARGETASAAPMTAPTERPGPPAAPTVSATGASVPPARVVPADPYAALRGAIGGEL